MPRLIRLWSFVRVKCSRRDEREQFVSYRSILVKNIMSMPLKTPALAIIVVLASCHFRRQSNESRCRRTVIIASHTLTYHV